MKKLLNHHSIITFVLSFLFTLFVCMNNVKADSTFNLDFSVFTDETLYNKYLLLKEATENFIASDETYSDFYLIYYNGTSSFYTVVFPLNYKASGYCDFSSSNHRLFFGSSSSVSYKRFSRTSSGSLSSSYNLSYKQDYLYSSGNSNTIIPVYSNVNFKINNGNITFNFEDFTFVNETGTSIKTLSELYSMYNETLVPSDLHVEEKEKISNFYNLIGEKLGYLSEQITKSYILLTIIGIFILIFVFELIYRRYL